MDTSDRRLRASEEAAAWWVRFRAGELERAEREEFVDWLRESAVHVAEMLRIAKVNDSLDQFQGWLQINTDGPQDEDENIVELPVPRKPVPSPGPPPSYRRFRWRGVIAASSAVLVLGAIGLFLNLRAQVIQTDRGERREVALADGSVLEVDPETRLRVAFEEHTRQVFLERGRALFKVARNPERPFLVQADGTTVRAVGTEFGVDHREQGIIVTVAEGKVGVSVKEALPPALPSPSEIPPPPPAKEVLLIAGQQVRMPSSGRVESVRKVDSERELAWAKGQLVFDNETVAAAVDEFNRYNRIQLRVADDALGKRTVSAVFDASDPESFIAFLQTEVSVQVTRSNGEIILH